MLELGFIYRITNLVNKKSYIGETANLNARMHAHLFSKDKTTSRMLTLDIEKFGSQNFELEVMEICLNREDRKRLEAFYISTFNATDPAYGYNRKNGEGRATGDRRTAADRRVYRKNYMQNYRGSRIARKGYGFRKDAEYRTKLSDAALRQWQDPAMREKMKKAAIEGWKLRRAKKELLSKV